MRAMNTGWELRLAVVALAIVVLAGGQTLAASGTWSETTGDGQWSNGGSWAGGTIADGAGFTADFSMVDTDAAAVNVNFPGFYRNAVDANTSRTIGHLKFGDANTSSPGGWEVYTSAAPVTITLSDAAPTINVTPLGPIDTGTLGDLTPEVIDDAAIQNGVGIASVNGFTKTGAGILTIAGANPDLHGTVTVGAGILRVGATATFDFETVTDAERTQFHLSGGTTLQAAAGVGQNAAGGTGISVAPGATATVRKLGAGSLFFANVGGAASTLNFESEGGTVSMDRDWNAGGALAAINLTGLGGVARDFRIRHTNGTFGTESFVNTAVNLTSATLFTTNFSGGSTFSFGSLSGDSTSTLRGGSSGTASTYQIGSLSTNTVFAGTIATGNGLNLFKRGTGTLELSGTLSYQPTADATLSRRGGITRIEAGTLKLSGAAVIQGGLNALTPSTVDVRSDATLDVSSIASYSTSPFQQIIGAGNVNGNFAHDEGLLAPGDTNVGGNTQTLTSVAGTITFNNNLSFAGSGGMSHTMAPTPAGANDKIQVNGSASLTGTPTVTPTFPTGVPAAGQTYTLLTANGGFGGTNPSGWTVLWPGRGAGPVPFTSGNDVRITTTAIVSHNLNWSGAAGADWNTTAVNWYNNTTSAADEYVEFDNVTFSDTFNGGSPTPVSNPAVTIGGVVSPSMVTINSDSTNYSFAGAGRIDGTGSLVKQGSSTVTISNGNTYTGGTTISGGTVNLGGTGALGTGAISLANGALHAGMAGNFTLPNAVAVSGASNVISNNNTGAQTLNLNGNISGSGTLALENNNPGVDPNPPVRNGIDLFGDNTGFHGTLALTGPTAVALRFRTLASAGTDIAYDLGNNVDAQLSTVIGANSTIPMGSLTGGVNARLSGHTSGGGAGTTVYQIGSLGTSTSFDGFIEDGNIGTNAANFTSVTKVGGGTLTLAGANIYTGDTRVQDGTLSLTQINPAMAGDVYLSTGSILNLGFVGEDSIDSLFIDNAPQAVGTWGRIGHATADFTSALITGDGLLEVLTLGVVPGLAGDYNGDNVVDAVDYTVWRNNLGALTEAPINNQGDGLNGVDANDYNVWKTNYGNTLPGSGGGGLASAVPEPASAVLLALALGAFASVRSRRVA
jgi:fibronectin-binding autotransporter adhesin